jgi:hypothetical protein
MSRTRPSRKQKQSTWFKQSRRPALSSTGCPLPRRCLHIIRDLEALVGFLETVAYAALATTEHLARQGT